MSMSSLRDAQYRFNKIKSEQLGRELMPTLRWVINEEDIKRRRLEKELSDEYRNAYLSWNNYIRDNCSSRENFERFGTSPVRNAYWDWKGKLIYKPPQKLVVSPDIFETFDPATHPCPTPPMTMVFKRYPNLSSPYDDMDVLVKSLLGMLDGDKTTGRKFAQGCKILNDAWTVNLIQPRENVMMEAFLKGFAGCDELKKQWEGKAMMGVDVGDELKDLLKVYTDAETHLKQREQSELESLETYMKRYMEVKAERKKVSVKLANLKLKLAPPKEEPCADCDDDEDEE